LLSFVIAGAPARADDEASRVAIARSLIDAIHFDATFKQIIPTLMKQIRDILVRQDPSIAKDLDAMLPRFEAKSYQRLDDLKAQMAKVYASRLTESELKDIAAFYQTPTGARLIALQPELAAQGMALGRAWGKEIAGEVIEEMKAELRKQGHAI
ncbi:DUF2059 domain-containing protein, partial [Rhodoblastus sp.]